MILEIERKFLVKSFISSEVYSCRSTKIIQWYLPKDDLGRSSRIRHMYFLDNGPQNRYLFTRKKQISFGVSEEEEYEISFSEYDKYLKKVDVSKRSIEKTRYYIKNEKMFELDIFHGFNQGLILLEIELKDLKEEFEIPKFIEIDKEVTNDSKYSNRFLARKK